MQVIKRSQKIKRGGTSVLYPKIPNLQVGQNSSLYRTVQDTRADLLTMGHPKAIIEGRATIQLNSNRPTELKSSILLLEQKTAQAKQAPSNQWFERDVKQTVQAVAPLKGAV